VLACLGQDSAPAGLLSFVRDHADGNPFVVEELLAGAWRAGALVRADGGWQVVERRLQPTVPPTVADSLTRRLTTLHPRTQRVLHAAALLGRRFDWELLPAVTGLDADVVLASLREATYAQLVEADPARPDGVRFRHALTRDHIAAAMLPPERAALAARTYDAVTATHPDLPDAWCTVAAALADLAGRRAVAGGHLVEAGRRAAAEGAYATATARLHAAVDLLTAAGEDTLAAREQLATVCALAGDVEAALGAGGPALDERRARADDPARAGELELALARALLVAGRYAQARALAVRARGEVAGSAAAATALLAQISVAAGDPASAVEEAQAVLASPEPVVPPAAACEAWEALGRAHRLRDLAAAEAAFTRALAVADEHALLAWRARALHELGTLDVLDTMRTDRLEAARRAAVEAGVPATVAVVDFHLGEALVGRGRTREGRDVAQRAARLAGRLGSSVQAPALLTLARSYAIERRAAEMEDAVAAALAADPGDPAVQAGAWGRARMFLALHQADRDAALEALDRAVGLLRGVPGHHFPYWGLWALLRTLADGDGHGVARFEAASAAGSDTRVNRAMLDAAAAVAVGPHDRATAAALHTRAVADLRGYVEGDWYVHITRWLAAPAAHRDGWGEPAADLQEAVRWFAGHDDPLLASDCRRLLREMGAPAPRRGRGSAPVPAPLLASGVSSREADVLLLLGRRLANREIAAELVLSPRTVEKHVASLLRKTGAADRSALARLAAVAADAEAHRTPG
jgi:DNA-binding CsgD family transcriptional regulator/tetratricopeptide (TPR) repeat protein